MPELLIIIRRASGPRRVRSPTSPHQLMNQWINQLLVLGSWSLVPRSWVLWFFWFAGRAYGGAPGGIQGDVPSPFHPWTTFQLRLKIALVFDTLFLRFWLHLGCQDDPQNPRKRLKNQLRNCTPTSKPLRSDSYRFFLRFSIPWGITNLAKTL